MPTECIEISDDDDIFTNSEPINNQITSPALQNGNDQYRSTGSLPTPPLSAAMPDVPPSVPVIVDSRSLSVPLKDTAPIESSSMTRESPRQGETSTQRSESDSTRSYFTFSSPDKIIESQKQNLEHGRNNFMDMVNVGRRIACILCDQAFDESLLFNHITEVHFWHYHPFKCTECDYRAAKGKILTGLHALETGHLENKLHGKRNKLIELFIDIVYHHSLEAHENDGNKENLINRLREATELLKKQTRKKKKAVRKKKNCGGNGENGNGGGGNASNVALPQQNNIEMVEIPKYDTGATTTNPPASSDLWPSPGSIDVLPEDMMDTHVHVSLPVVEDQSTTVSSNQEAPTGVFMRHCKARKSISRSFGGGMTSPFEPKENQPPNMDMEQGESGNDENENEATDSNNSSPPILTPELNTSSLIVPADTTTTGILSTIIIAPQMVPVPELVNEPSASNTPTPTPTTTLICEFCGAVPMNLAHLVDHCKKMHTGGYAPYVCTYDNDCVFSTWRQYDLREHALSTHRQRLNLMPISKPNVEQREQVEKVITFLVSKNANCSELNKCLN